MRGFRVWSDYWEKYATEAELYMDGSADAVFEDDGGVPHHENTDLVLEFDTGLKDKNGKEIYEWFDRMAFGQKAEEIIAWKLAESFTDEELQKLVKVDMKKVEKMVVEKIAERVVDRCMKSKAFKGGE